MPLKKKTTRKRAKNDFSLVPEKIAPLVLHLRRERVLLDSDLADLYGVETKALNQAVKRNLERFPEDFIFQLANDEWEAANCLRSQIVTANADSNSLKSQIATSKLRGGRRTPPYAFTEQGVAMLSSVLRSPRAVEVNIAIMRTFVQLRKLMVSNKLLAEKIESLEKKYDEQFRVVFEAIRQLIADDSASKKRRIGFHP